MDGSTPKSIVYAKPSIGPKEIDYVLDAVTNGWGEHCYDYLERFRGGLRNYFGVRHAFPTSSCHGALHIALAALGVGPGDEVIVPDITWIGSVAPIVWLGATPVFVDILRDSWCIDPAKAAAAVTPRTKAIVVVHLYGNLAEMDAILEVAAAHGIPVVEDAAEAVGSEYRGRKAGALGDIGVLSFHGTKTITTGEGGAILCNRDELAETIAVLENQGRNRMEPRFFWCERVGYKYKMSNIQAALGLAQLERADELVARKRETFRWYREALRDFDDIAMNPEPPHTQNCYWMPTVVFGKSHAFDRDDLVRELNSQGIAVRPFFYPLTLMPMFPHTPANEVSRDLHSRAINLPSAFDLTASAAADVIARMRTYFSRHVPQ